MVMRSMAYNLYRSNQKMDIGLFNHLRNVFSNVFFQKEGEHLIIALLVKKEIFIPLLWSPRL